MYASNSNLVKKELSAEPVKTNMTIDEFLQHDVERYEYIKGELVPMPAAP